MCLFEKLFSFAIDDATTIPFVQVCSMWYKVINPLFLILCYRLLFCRARDVN